MKNAAVRVLILNNRMRYMMIILPQVRIPPPADDGLPFLPAVMVIQIDVCREHDGASAASTATDLLASGEATDKIARNEIS